MYPVIFHWFLCSIWTVKGHSPSGWWKRHQEEYTLDTAHHRWRCCRTPPPHPRQGTETSSMADTCWVSLCCKFIAVNSKRGNACQLPLQQASHRWERPSPTSPPPGCSRRPLGPPEPEIPESRRKWRCDLRDPSLDWKQFWLKFKPRIKRNLICKMVLVWQNKSADLLYRVQSLWSSQIHLHPSAGCPASNLWVKVNTACTGVGSGDHLSNDITYR